MVLASIGDDAGEKGSGRKSGVVAGSTAGLGGGGGGGGRLAKWIKKNRKNRGLLICSYPESPLGLATSNINLRPMVCGKMQRYDRYYCHFCCVPTSRSTSTFVTILFALITDDDTGVPMWPRVEQ